jgi:hypothetical protein
MSYTFAGWISLVHTNLIMNLEEHLGTFGFIFRLERQMVVAIFLIVMFVFSKTKFFYGCR